MVGGFYAGTIIHASVTSAEAFGHDEGRYGRYAGGPAA